jgi:hypothetical protein
MSLPLWRNGVTLVMPPVSKQAVQPRNRAILGSKRISH